jgi:hypothetical protein
LYLRFFDVALSPTTLSGLDKTAMVLSWNVDATASVLSSSLVRGKISTTSGIEFYRGVTTGNCSGHWFTFEDRGNNFTVNHFDDYYTGVISDTEAINDPHCIDPNRTFMLGSMASDYNSSWSSRTTSSVGLASDGSIKSEKDDATGGMYWVCQIVEFVDTTKVYTPLGLSFKDINTNTGNSPYEINFSPACSTATSTPIVASMQGIGSNPTNGATSNANTLWSYEVTATGTLSVEFQDDTNVDIIGPYMSVVDWAGVTVLSGINDSIIPEGSGEGQSFVKSVENISENMTESESNISLSKGQNWQNCAMFVSCRASSASSNIKDQLVNVYFTDEGLIHLKKPPGTLDRVVEISVVEFWPNQVKVQQKRIFTNNNTTTSVQIDPVSSLDKCFITNTVFPSDATYYTRDVMPRVNFSTVSGVDIYIYNNASTSYKIDVAFFVVEDLGSNFSVSHNSSNFTSSALDPYYSSSTHFPMDNTIPIVSYTNDANTTWATRTFCGAHFDYEHVPVTAQKYDLSSGGMYWNGSVVKFLGNKRHTHNDFIVFSSAVSSQTGSYPSKFIPNANALSCFNIMQGTTFAVNSTNAAAHSQGFSTVKITDTVSGIYEVSRPSSDDYDTSGGVVLVDWIGYYTPTSGTNVKTRSMIQSVQSEYSTSSYYDSSFPISLTKGQDSSQCVPFVTNSCTFTSTYYYMSCFYKAVYRYEDGFIVSFASSYDEEQRVSNRDINIDVVEFGDDVNIQYGEVSTPDLSVAVTIDSVNLDRAFLIFYATIDDHDIGNRSITVCGRFSSSTELTFIRVYNTGNMSISWYVVECTEESDYWTVQHNYHTGLGASSSLSVPLESAPNISKSMFFASWAMSNSSSSYVSRSVYKGRHSYDDNAVFTKTDVTYYDMDYCNVEVVEFTDNYKTDGIRIMGVENSFTTGTSMDVTFNTISGASFDLSRSVVWNINAGNENQINTNNVNAWQETFMTQRFKDGDTLTFTRGYGSYTTDSYTFIGEFPEYNKYYMEGYVQEEGSPVAREVVSFRKSTNQMTDSTTSSSGTGYFWLESPYGDEHYVVAFDDDSGTVYNDLVYGQITPTVISGCFAYNEGLTTTSGFDIGVPLGRQ